MMHPKGPRRIYAWDLGNKLVMGVAPLIVCAFGDSEKCAKLKIDGSISMKELEAGLDSIPKDREIVFFCSSPQDITATERAAEYQQKGYTRVEVLSGGIDAWNAISGFL
jgi:hypothetical protein